MFGLHAAYNLLVLLSFPAAGLAAYGLARRLTGDPVAALVAGVGFALLPARLDPLFGGHPAGFALALVPAVLWGLDVALTRRRVVGGVGGGLAFLALAMLEPQYTYLAGGLVVAHVATRAWLGRTSEAGSGGRSPRSACSSAAGVGWVFMLRAAFVAGSIADVGRRSSEVRLFSPGPARSRDPARTAGPPSPRSRSSVSRARARAGDGGLRLLYGGILASGLVLMRGSDALRVPALRGAPPLAPALRDDPEPEEARAPRGRRQSRPGGLRSARHPGPPRGGRAPRRRLIVAGVLTGLVLVATPPWHGIAVARFGDSPVFEALRRGATRVAVSRRSGRGTARSRSLYLYAITRTPRAGRERVLARSCRGTTCATSSSRSRP